MGCSIFFLNYRCHKATLVPSDFRVCNKYNHPIARFFFFTCASPALRELQRHWPDETCNTRRRPWNKPAKGFFQHNLSEVCCQIRQRCHLCPGGDFYEVWKGNIGEKELRQMWLFVMALERKFYLCLATATKWQVVIGKEICRVYPFKAKSTALWHQNRKKCPFLASCPTQFPCPPSACTKGQDLPPCCHKECLALQRKKKYASDSSPAIKGVWGWVWIEMEVCSGRFQLAADPETTLFSVRGNAENPVSWDQGGKADPSGFSSSLSPPFLCSL